jgi:hypothetical protein
MTLKELLTVTTLPQRAANNVMRLVYADMPGDTEKLEFDEVLTLLAADILRQARLESDEYLPVLKHIRPNIAEFGMELYRALDGPAKDGVPAGFIEILDRRYVGFHPPSSALFDMETGEVADKGVILPRPPILSEAVFLTGVYLRTAARFFGHDAAAELWSAGLLTWQYGDEHSS